MVGRGLGRSRSRRLPRSQIRLPSRWKGKVGHTGDLGECRGGTAAGALGSDDMLGSAGSSVLGSGGWAAGERMPRRVGLLPVTWGAKSAGGYRPFCEAFGTICCQELSLSSQPSVGAGSVLPAFCVGHQPPALGSAPGSLSQFGVIWDVQANQSQGKNLVCSTFRLPG